MVNIIARIIKSQKRFKNILVIVKATRGYIIWIFHGRGEGRTTRARYLVYGVGCVRGRDRRVDLLKDNNVILAEVCVKATKERPVLRKFWEMV